MKSFVDYDHCLCKFGPEELFGYGNFTVNILGEGGKLKKSLFFFDSGRDILDRDKEKYNLPKDMGGYDFLKNEQIDFYKNEVANLKKQYGNAESFLYFHIPLCEYAHAFKEDENGKFVPSGECEIFYGHQYESVGCSTYNSGMFDAMLETGSGQAVFCGHDHINDWHALYKGIHLVYNQAGGYAVYNLGDKTDLPESEWLEGVTVTTIHNDGTFDIANRYNSMYL
jgi:hypothetical protein